MDKFVLDYHGKKQHSPSSTAEKFAYRRMFKHIKKILRIALKWQVFILRGIVPHLKIISIFSINVWYISFPFSYFLDPEWEVGLTVLEYTLTVFSLIPIFAP
jgi:hypothetical protein